MTQAYVPDNADATHGRVAQLIGGMLALNAILEAKANGVQIARPEDINEVFSEEEQQ